MNRRGFLASMAAFALDPERLVWTPDRKLISIPAPRVELVRSIALFRGVDLGGSTYYSYWVKSGVWEPDNRIPELPPGSILVCALELGRGRLGLAYSVG